MKLDNKDIIKKYIKNVEENAWYGGRTTVNILTEFSKVKILGYIIEPGYESFETASKIMLDDEILFAEDSRSIANYRNEKYSYGKFQTMEEALDYIVDKLRNKEYEIVYE